VTVVVDSHALVWFGHTTSHAKLSSVALRALRAAAHARTLHVSAASFIDLWYVAHAKHDPAVTPQRFLRLRELVARPEHGFVIVPIDTAVTDAFAATAALTDPWDRLITATAKALGLPLVTADRSIREAGVVDVIW